MAKLQMCLRGGSDWGMRPGWLIRFQYDVDLVERLKNMIPHTYREWHQGPKSWWVSEEYEDELNELFSNWYALAKQQLPMFKEG